VKLEPQQGILPDSWVIIEILHGAETMSKILAGWSGGYLDGDSWRMSSPIKHLDIDTSSEYIIAHTESGSVYTLYRDSQGLRMSNAGIWNQLKETHGDMVRIVEL